MTDQFDRVIACVRQKYADLCACPKCRIANLPAEMPTAGIYLFSEAGKALYVGRTNSLRKRLQGHTRSTHNQATFAFLLARHQTGNLKASYKPEGSRQHLLENPDFRAAFDAARERIKGMDVQFVEEVDPVKQTVLEVFVALETKAEFNCFDNH
jgi:hypothetical protein